MHPTPHPPGQTVSSSVALYLTHSLHDCVFWFKSGFDFLFDWFEVFIWNFAQLLIWIQAEIATETKGLSTTNTVESGKSKLKTGKGEADERNQIGNMRRVDNQKSLDIYPITMRIWMPG